VVSTWDKGTPRPTYRTQHGQLGHVESIFDWRLVGVVRGRAKQCRAVRHCDVGFLMECDCGVQQLCDQVGEEAHCRLRRFAGCVVSSAAAGGV
jgi:hypothetical protein